MTTPLFTPQYEQQWQVNVAAVSYPRVSLASVYQLVNSPPYKRLATLKAWEIHISGLCSFYGVDIDDGDVFVGYKVFGIFNRPGMTERRYYGDPEDGVMSLVPDSPEQNGVMLLMTKAKLNGHTLHPVRVVPVELNMDALRKRLHEHGEKRRQLSFAHGA